MVVLINNLKIDKLYLCYNKTHEIMKYTGLGNVKHSLKVAMRGAVCLFLV